MPDDIDLAPVRFAALVAPALDRVFVGAMAASANSGGRELVTKYGGRDAVGLMIDLRNAFSAGRSVGREIVDVSPYIYRDPSAVVGTLERSADAGLLEVTDDGRFAASDLGLSFLGELMAQHASLLGDRWANHADRVGRLNDVVAQLLRAAAHSGGAGWATYFPIHEPDGTAAPVVLLNRLQLLRHHRADAHIAAWQAAGLLANQMAAMPAGLRRDAIEHDTNVRAAVPYAEVSAKARLTMLADLAALP